MGASFGGPVAGRATDAEMGGYGGGYRTSKFLGIICRLSVKDSKRPGRRALSGLGFEHDTVWARRSPSLIWGFPNPPSNSPVQKPWKNRGISGVVVPEVYEWANWMAEGEKL